jgi:transketolase
MGFYGTSHHSLEDIGIMRTIADLTVVCATDANHLRAILRESLTHDGAMYIRLGRGRDPEVYEEVPKLTFGKSIKLRSGSDLAIVATGSEVYPSLEAATQLASSGIHASVYDFHTLKPFDFDALSEIASHGNILTVEEHNRTNGLGTAFAEALMDGGLGHTRLYRHGIPDVHVPVGPPASLYAHYRLDSAGIFEVAQEFLGVKSK